MNLDTATIGIIGAGNMAEAILRGMLSSGLVKNTQVTACDPAEFRRNVFSTLGVNVSEDATQAAACDIVLLSVKPQVMDTVMQSVSGSIKNDALVISIAAGIGCKLIEQHLPEGARLVRVMPNTPMLVGSGVSAICKGASATDEDIKTVSQIFGSAGYVCEVDEPDMDAVTAVSGSGPAYVFRFVGALTAAGELAGLSSEQSAELARKTVIGAARMLEECDDTPSVLRENVTSPGGTTEAALKSFKKNNFEKIICEAVIAGKQRSIELGNK